MRKAVGKALIALKENRSGSVCGPNQIIAEESLVAANGHGHGTVSRKSITSAVGAHRTNNYAKSVGGASSSHRTKKSTDSGNVMSVKNNRDFKEAVEAMKNDNHLELQKVLACNCELVSYQYKEAKGSPYLVHKAAILDRPHCFDVLVQHGASETVCGTDGNTIVHHAVAHGSIAFLKHVLQFFPLVNKPNYQNLAAIHIAAKLDKLELMKVLLGCTRVDVVARGDRGRTALHYASEIDAVEVAKLLLDNGGYPCIACNSGYSSVHVSVLNGSRRVLNAIIEHCSNFGYTKEMVMNFCDKNLSTPLHVAVSNGDVESVKMCLEFGSKIDGRMEDDSTSIHLAAALGHDKILRHVIEVSKGEDVECVFNSQDFQGLTPLHSAAMFNQIEAVKVLVENGSPVNTQDTQGNSPLMLAIIRGSEEVVQYLKDVSDLNLRDKEGRNMVHLAMLHSTKTNSEIFTFIKNSLSDPHSNMKDMEKHPSNMLQEKDRYGCTAVHYAVLGGRLKSLGWLLNLECPDSMVQSKSNLNEFPLHYAARLGRYNACVNLLATRAGMQMLNSRNNRDRTPVMLAASNGYNKVVKLLISRGALLVHNDLQGYTALHYAAVGGYTHTMRVLLATKKTLIDMADNEQNTALHVSADKNQRKSIELLLSMKCALTLNEYGQSALDLALDGKKQIALEAFFHHDRWLEVFSFFGPEHDSPFRKVIQNMPEMAQALMDKSIETSNVNPNCPDYWSHCADTFSPEEIAAIPDEPFALLEMMAEQGQQQLLVHPLCSSYMEAKWKKYGQKVIVFMVMLYTLFLISISAIALDKIKRVRVPNNMLLKNTDDAHYRRMIDSYIDDMSWWVCGCIYFSTIGSAFDIISMIMLYLSVKKTKEEMDKEGQSRSKMLGNMGFIAKIRLLISAILTFFLGVTLIVPHGNYHIYACDFYILGIVSFLAWFQVLDVLQPFTTIGIYVVMYNEILLTTCKLIAIFFSLLFGFAVGFLVFFGGLEYTTDEELQNYSFASFPSALSKVFSMMLGEIDMTVTFIRNYEAGILTWCDLCFVVSFILLVCILFINLTIGLAVGDIAQLTKHSKVKGIQMTVALFVQMEAHMKRLGLDKFTKIPLSKTIYLSKMLCAGSRRKLLESLTSKDEAEHMKLLKMIHQENEKNHIRIKSLNESMHKAEELLGLVITHLEVQSPYDNQDEGHKLYPGNNPTSITDLIDLSDCMTCVEDYDEKEKVCFQNMNSCCA
ncbi:transient receptor potential cation channel subfamily A member 1-like isoform X2 [Convolutriloba macropyga]|uniref:transient receptor potential cation channel subfamily A member 1-like isoform X2 n=1 Tax=Convolutriloba macropyga TaxID=536237 RepID=UPI003F527111